MADFLFTSAPTPSLRVKGSHQRFPVRQLYVERAQSRRLGLYRNGNPRADDTFKGTGRLEGKLMEVQWGNPQPVIYVLRPDGTLHGTWGNGEALEKLTPVR